MKLPKGRDFTGTGKLLRDLGLRTVCQDAKCPNIFECFSQKVAAFLVLGKNCTRNCAFCNISPGRPEPVDATEPERVAEAVLRLRLRHAVITSVTRDDLPDGGAAHFARVIEEIRGHSENTSVEVLIPDFQGHKKDLKKVLDMRPEVLNHNLETAPELYPDIRPQADYRQSLNLLKQAKRTAPDIKTKSGFMVGLGETDTQISGILHDLARAECDIVTIGQYMRPSARHPRVQRYVPPQTFEQYRRVGEAAGIRHVFAAPLVRSSYNAAAFIDK
ncbi:MAG: lipoyl synthase [Desulfonatronovibrionaceae bacterium]